VTPFPVLLAFDKAYFLGVSADNGTELSPRTALSAVPYALHADVADGVSSSAAVVTRVNGQSGELTLQGGGGTTITNTGGTFTISSVGGSGTGIQGVQNTDGTLSIANANGPLQQSVSRTTASAQPSCRKARSLRISSHHRRCQWSGARFQRNGRRVDDADGRRFGRTERRMSGRITDDAESERTECGCRDFPIRSVRGQDRGQRGDCVEAQHSHAAFGGKGTDGDGCRHGLADCRRRFDAAVFSDGNTEQYSIHTHEKGAGAVMALAVDNTAAQYRCKL